MTTTATPKPLYITGIPAGDRLLHRDGTALLIGMLLDQQVPMEWAFTGPYTIKQRLGHCDAKKIAAMNAKTSTMTVEIRVSRREGQVTLAVSDRTC